MPIPGSVLSELLPFGVTAALAAYESLATLRPPTQTESTTGGLINTFADSVVAAYVNMPCRIAPYVLERPREQEFNRQRTMEFDARFHVSIAKSIPIVPETLALYQIKVDGVVYQIIAVEPDGSGQTTRLLVSDAVPFVE